MEMDLPPGHLLTTAPLQGIVLSQGKENHFSEEPMKIFLALILSVVTTSAFAGTKVIDGRMSLTLSPQYGNGSYGLDIRNEGGKILGNTFLGPVNMVNLERTSDGVKGWAGGIGTTTLTCSAVTTHSSKCTGYVAGTSADFTITEEQLNNGSNLKVEGAMNHRHFSLTRNVYGTIDIGSNGGMNLKLKSPGHYTGSGSLTSSPYSSFDASMTTDGNMLEMDGLTMAIFLAAPLTVLQ
jgi:hypothetical protein